MYAFSKRTDIADIYPVVLSNEEIAESFAQVVAIGVLNVHYDEILSLGRRYEQFYLRIFDVEAIDCVVNYNLLYAFQGIGHLLAKKLKLKTVVVESGLFRPFTLTVERDGVNAQSSLSDWKYSEQRDPKAFDSFSRFLQEYKSYHLDNTNSFRPGFDATIRKVLKGLYQWAVYDRYDPEIYPHLWKKRIQKLGYNAFAQYHDAKHFEGKKYFCFFLSSFADPQLDIPPQRTIEELLSRVIEGFQLFARKNSECMLVIKEHPYDYKRILYRRKYTDEGRIFWSRDRAHALIQKSTAVITMNSGVGIDALVYNKPLLCLLPSLYSHSEIALVAPRDVQSTDVALLLEQLISYAPNKNKIGEFLLDVYTKTQISQWDYQNRKMSISEEFHKRLDTLISSR
jgi:capsule polysaccharide modification protein KpsS